MTKAPKIAANTIGCKVNQYDTAAMLALFLAKGYQQVDFDAPADVYLVNTCTVTAMADKKSRQMLNRVRKLSPDAIICAAGCLSQKDGEQLKEKCDVDVIIGNADRERIVELVEQNRQEKHLVTDVTEIRKDDLYEDLNSPFPPTRPVRLSRFRKGAIISVLLHYPLCAR